MDFLMEIKSKNHPTCSRMSFPSHLLWRLMALLFILAEISQRIIGCPETCACFTPSEVHCAFRYLSEAPRGINKAVQRVNLGYNSLSGIKMSDFSGLKRLELLMLHSNTIKTIEDSSFCDLASLQVLKMSYNKVEKLNKDTFKGLDNLVRLHVDNNLITFIHPESFYGLKMLQLINLEGNQLQQLHPDTFITLRFGQILKWSSFKTIYLSDNALRTLPAALLSGSSMIENLFLSGNPWSCDCRMSWLAEWIKKHPDSGVYHCIATNYLDADVLDFRVTVMPTDIEEEYINGIKVSYTLGQKLSLDCTPPVIGGGKAASFTVLSNSDAFLPCEATGNPQPIISWNRYTTGKMLVIKGKMGKFEVLKNGTLLIQRTNIKDQGQYICNAQNKFGSDKLVVTLSVVAYPTRILETRIRDLKVIAGKTVTLECRTEGRPEPVVSWILPNHTEVRDVEINQSGKYECIAANSMGADHRVVTFSVMKKDTVPKIISTSQYQTVVVYGGHLHLNCSAAGDPKPRILWRIPSKGLVDQSNRMGSSIKVLENGSLIIESVTEKDAGDFLCVASNKLGEDVQLMRVSISMKPARIEPKAFGKKQVLYGNDVKVDCVAAGLPIPEISWGLPDGTLVNSALQADGAEGDPFRRYVLFDNGTLFLNKVGTDEEGDYTCYAENKLGKDQMHIHISVISAAPHIQPPDLSQAKVKPGGNIRFDCKAIGEPKPKILWMLPSKDIIAASNERFLVHANGSLDIRNIKLSDVGEYVCMARSSAGEDTNVYKLDLDGNSPVINGFNQNRTVLKDTAIKFSRKLIDCQAEGNPPPKITWVMPDNIFLTAPYYGSRINVHRNGTLEIRNVRPSDTAEFICIAQNDGGEAVMLVQLEVTENLRRPIFNNPFNERVVTKVGGTAVLNCSADGHPKPEILWTLPNRTAFTGGPGTFGSRYLLEKDGTLVICNSTSEDTGKYRCAAKNKVGYIEKLVVFEVIRKPYILTRPKGIIRALSGESLFLHCLTDGVKSTISWSTPGGLILPHKKVIGRYNLLENGTLVVRETTMRDRGNYVCRAKNDAGEAVLAVSVLIVAQSARITNGPPPTLKGVSGVPVQLKCVANGIPTPDIIWELPDHTILSTTGKGQSLGKEHLHAHGTLIIRKPTIGHSGNYKCIAFNYLGRDTSTTFLTIL
ncbi:hypothetical protein DNTS_031772 [Danionella cerebrum]|uniref:Ig-like domain-containing protein n=1 Tax=Danionella cerebrum TaxID=2873325 RepID=A0A553MYT1_9TELE|nr:hypothetical protein DNTS_031772 [Danionella translucida]